MGSGRSVPNKLLAILETLRVKKHFLTPETLLLTRFGGSGRTLGDSPVDSPGDSFLTF